MDSPFNLFHVGTLSGDHHINAVHDTLLVDAESAAAWAPRIATAKRLFPALDVPGARMVKDKHFGSDKAYREETQHSVPFNCAVHERRDMMTNAVWGIGEERRALVQLYDACVREPNPRNVQRRVVEFKATSERNGWNKAATRLLKCPMESTFPSMRAHPTAYTNRGQIGALRGQITSNEAEITMHAMLPVRREGCLARAQV